MKLNDEVVKALSVRAVEISALAELPSGLRVRAAAEGKPATIYMYDFIGSGGITDGDFSAALAQAGSDRVVMHVNSAGGDVWTGISIRNALVQHGNVEAIVEGVAASAAAYILTGARKVSMRDNAMAMIHCCHTIAAGSKQHMRELADTMEKIDVVQARMFAERTGRPLDEVTARLEAETWFTAEEAREFGLADEIIPAPKRQKKAVAAQQTQPQAEPKPEQQEPRLEDAVERRRRLLRVLDADEGVAAK